MSNNAHVGELIKGWLKRQSALDEKADNARELGLDYEPSKTIIEMAREAGFDFSGTHLTWEDVICTEELKTFATLIRADERNRTWTPSEWSEYERSIAAAEREKFLGALRQLHDSYALQSDPSGLRARGQA